MSTFLFIVQHAPLSIQIALVALVACLAAIAYVIGALIANRRAMNRAIREREEIRRELSRYKGGAS